MARSKGLGRRCWRSVAFLSTIALLTYRNVRLEQEIRAQLGSWSSIYTANHSCTDSGNKTKQALPQPPLPPQSNRSIVFMHVGKCGGTSISSILRHGCFNSAYGKECSKFELKLRNGYRQITLSTLVAKSYHVWNLPRRHKLPLKKFNSFLVNTRDPFDRCVSAFRMQHPKSKVKMVKRNRINDFAFQCFPSFEHFAMALGDANKAQFKDANGNQQSRPLTITHETTKAVHNCTTIAQTTMQGIQAGGREKMYVEHLYYNYQFYLRAIPPHAEIFVTRVSHLWDDVKHINMLLGGSVDQFDTQTTGHLRDSTKGSKALSMNIGEEGRRYVCRHLKNEYRLYFLLLERAVNLTPEEVEEERKISSKKCPELFEYDRNDKGGVSLASL